MNKGLFGYPTRNLGSNFNFFPKRQVIKDSIFGFPYNFPSYILQCTPTTDNYAFSFIIKGAIGTNLIVDWGDGSSTTINFTGADQTINKTYLAQVSYNINFIGDTTVVTKLICSNKSLTGKLPLNLATIFPNIDNFNVSTNKIGGIIPDLSTWVNITDFSLQNNRFEGGLFNINNWTQLTNFNIGNNPTMNWQCPDFSACTNLLVFGASASGLFGELPSFGNCINLTNFNISSNSGLNGSLPDFNSCFLLNTFNINNCNFTGVLPSFSACVNLVDFECQANQFTNNLPDFSTCTKMSTFYCGINQFSGVLPSFNLCVLLTDFRCFTNQFSGALPNFNSCTSLITFSCHNNQFTSITGIPNAKMTICNLYNNALDQVSVDLVFYQLDTIFSASAPTSNLAVNINLGTNASPTGGMINTNIIHLGNIFTSALKLLTININ